MTSSNPPPAAAPAGSPRPSGRRRLRWPARLPPAHILVPLVVIVAVGALLFDAAAEALRPATPVTVAPVVFERHVERQPAGEPPQSPGAAPGEAAAIRGTGRAVQAAGWLEADPFFIAATALADGVVSEILVLEGDRVEQGEVIARLVDDDARLALSRAEADVQAQQAAVRAAEADLAAATGDWENPVERDRAVAAGRAALAETEAELAQLPAIVAAEQARLEGLNEELDRSRQVYQRQASNELEVILLEKSAAAQAATVESLRQREAILNARRDREAAELRAAERHAELRIAERRTLDAATADLEAARAALAQARAARDEAQLRLDRMTINAPVTGYVMRRLKSPGDKVMLGMDDTHSAHIAHLYDPEHIQVRVDVPLADAAGVFVGQQCEVVVEVLPDRTLTGEVTRITHQADVQKNTLEVKVKVLDPDPLLRPEMLTRVKFLPDAGRGSAGGDGDDRRAAVLVPDASIDRRSAGAQVWVVRDRRAGRGIVQPVSVAELSYDESSGETAAAPDAPGGRRPGWTPVRADLRPGDLLAIDPQSLTAGQRVRMRAAGDVTEGQS